MNFPLYHDLLKNISENDEKISEQDKGELIKKIKKLDDAGHELIYALIRSYQLEHDNTIGLPYDSKILKLGMKFDLEKIPNKCCRILILFCDKHLEKMKEEQKLLKNRK
jgi:hypothetical protein